MTADDLHQLLSLRTRSAVGRARNFLEHDKTIHDGQRVPSKEDLRCISPSCATKACGLRSVVKAGTGEGRGRRRQAHAGQGQLAYGEQPNSKRMEYLVRQRITGGLRTSFLLCGPVFGRMHNSLVKTHAWQCRFATGEREKKKRSSPPPTKDLH